MGYSREERLALCATLEKAGPDAPTLCAGWTTRDLAAHLVLRERRPDAAAGIPGGPLAGHTAKVQRRLAATPYPALLATIRSGPPRLSPFAIPALDELANTVEFFVHNEDVRRAAPDWAPREISPGLSGALWDRLRMARFTLRKAPVGVEFARHDGGAGPDGKEDGADRPRDGGGARVPHDGPAQHAGRDRDRQAGRTHPVGVGPDQRGAGAAGRHRGCDRDAVPGQLAALAVCR